MKNNYFKQKQIIAKVDKKGNVIGKIERWQAHEDGILHKGLTIALIYKDQFIVQHRKHPAFDGVFDITSSSHQLFVSGKLQTTLEAVYDCLSREWRLARKDLLDAPKNLGSIYYKAKDPKSIYTEHEICDVLTAGVKEVPKINLDFAYGYSLIKHGEIIRNKEILRNLAPWIRVAIEENKL